MKDKLYIYTSVHAEPFADRTGIGMVTSHPLEGHLAYVAEILGYYKTSPTVWSTSIKGYEPIEAQIVAVARAVHLGGVWGEAEVVSLDKYPIQALTLWFPKWAMNGYKKKNGDPVKHINLLKVAYLNSQLFKHRVELKVGAGQLQFNETHIAAQKVIGIDKPRSLTQK